MHQELKVFLNYLNQRRLKHSSKRNVIAEAFLKTDQHLSAEDLYSMVKKNHPQIGYTTVYRTLKLIVESGVAQVLDFDDGVKRYERKLNREDHAHFICQDCHQHFEVFDTTIKGLSVRLADEKGFLAQRHRLEIFGICRTCHFKKNLNN